MYLSQRGEDAGWERAKEDIRYQGESRMKFVSLSTIPWVVFQVHLCSLSRAGGGILSSVSNRGWHPVGGRLEGIILVRQFTLVGRPSKKKVLEHATSGKRGGSERR